ncbi:MAG TPA: DUF6491 family protein [Steroidobacter sp.]
MRSALFALFSSCVLAAIGFGAAAQDEAGESAKPARIPFANLGGIRNWRATDWDTLYVQARNGQWYRAELMGPCPGLDFAHTIGFVLEPTGSFDSFSSILVDGEQCRLKSLVRSEPPSAGTRGRSGEATTASAHSDEEPADSAADKTEDRSGQSASEPASIPFADLGGIENWRVMDDETLYIEGRSGQWYRAELMAPCPGLRFEEAVGFVVEPTGSFERFSSILVDGRECHLKSLTRSEEPDKRR